MHLHGRKVCPCSLDKIVNTHEKFVCLPGLVSLVLPSLLMGRRAKYVRKQRIILSVQRKKNAINILVETAKTLKVKVKGK